jgi:outer membrane cobalamin receptor
VARRAALSLLLCIVPGVADDAAAQVGARIRVVVHAESEHAGPVSGAVVSVPSAGVSGATDAGGAVELSGLEPGRHLLRVTALGFAPTEAEVYAVNGRGVVVSVRLPVRPIELEGLQVRSRGSDVPTGGVAISVDQLDPTTVDVASAIDRIPGATVIRQGGPGAPAVVQLRGSAAGQVLVLLDGVPLNAPVTGIADLSTVDLRSLERIVVLPGAQSARYGPRALGGVVLLESRRPTRPHLAFSAGAGSWSTREFGATGSTRLSPGWSLSGGARWEESVGDFTYEIPSFRGGGETSRTNARHHRRGGDIRMERLGRLRLALQGHASVLDRGSPGSVVQPSATGHQDHERYGTTLDIDVGSGTRGATIQTGVQWQQALYADSAPPFGTPYDVDTRVRRDRAAAEAWTSWRGVELRGGAELSRMDVRSTTLTVSELMVEEVGAWTRLQTTVALRPGARLDVGGGLRLDRHDLVAGTTASPALEAVFTSGGTSVQAGWAFGFAPPGLGDLFFQEGVLVAPNPDLRPERVRNEITATAGHRLTIRGTTVEVRASAYDADVDDMILWFPDFRFVWSPVNFDVARAGVEIDGSAEVTVLGRRHALSARAAWSSVEYRGEALEGQVAYRPDFTGGGDLRVELPLGALTTAWRHVGERRSAPGSELNVLPAYDVIDVGVSLPFSLLAADSRMDFAVTNVLDERAALLADYPLPGRGWSLRLRATPR